MFRPWVAIVLWAVACGGADEKEAEFDTDGGVPTVTSEPTGSVDTTTCADLCSALAAGTVDAECAASRLRLDTGACSLSDDSTCLECLSGIADVECAEIQSLCVP